MWFEVWGVKVGNESHGEELYEFKHIVCFNNEEGIMNVLVESSQR